MMLLSSSTIPGRSAPSAEITSFVVIIVYLARESEAQCKQKSLKRIVFAEKDKASGFYVDRLTSQPLADLQTKTFFAAKDAKDAKKTIISL